MNKIKLRPIEDVINDLLKMGKKIDNCKKRDYHIDSKGIQTKYSNGEFLAGGKYDSRKNVKCIDCGIIYARYFQNNE